MKLLIAFSALSMCSIALLALLPEGSLRKTALLAAGLLMAAMWLDQLPSFGLDLAWEDASAAWLVPVDVRSIRTRQQQMIESTREVTEHGQTAGMAAP